MTKDQIVTFVKWVRQKTPAGQHRVAIIHIDRTCPALARCYVQDASLRYLSCCKCGELLLRVETTVYRLDVRRGSFKCLGPGEGRGFRMMRTPALPRKLSKWPRWYQSCDQAN
jgi:hypothetical protein